MFSVASIYILTNLASWKTKSPAGVSFHRLVQMIVRDTMLEVSQERISVLDQHTFLKQSVTGCVDKSIKKGRKDGRAGLK